MLNYFALSLLIFVALVLFYGIIALHDIPYDIAKAREHPQQDAIHVAGWISLFTLHAIWPFLWIWATLYRKDRGWGFIKESEEKEDIAKLQSYLLQMQTKIDSFAADDKVKVASLTEHIQALQTRIETFTEESQALQSRIEAIESKDSKETP
jgi:hypothetical protein